MKDKKLNVYIKTFGCSLNYSDSELMAGLLMDAGFNVITNYGLPESEWKKNSDSKIRPDIVIINSCTVKNLAQSKFIRELHKWREKAIPVIAAGCIPQAEPGLLDTLLNDIPVIGTRQLIKTVRIVNDMLEGRIVQDVSNDYNQRLNLPKIRKTGIIEIIPISEGCLSNCSFCKTKLARGNLHSYPKEQIIAQFKTALADGCKEFWITSQDNGCYGFDIYRREKYFLPQLLNELLEIEGDFRIRLGMANPDNIKRIKKDLIETFKNPKMFKFLHIPVQSGNDNVLKLMKRIYTVSDYKGIVDSFRKEISRITISTDIIVGFPGETEAAFHDTLRLIREKTPDVLNLSRFWLRKGTAAEKMKQLDSKTIKIRSSIIIKEFQKINIRNNSSLIGAECEVLIDETGRKDTLIGRSEQYKQVILQSKHSSLNIGDKALVRIIDAGPYYIKGALIKVC